MEEIKTIDARGLSCPQPALLAQQALRSAKEGVIQVLVDTATARDNVARAAQKSGWQAAAGDGQGGGFIVELKK